MNKKEINVQTGEIKVIELTPEEIAIEQAKEEKAKAVAYIRKRQLEYPNFADYLDGIIKGDQAQIQKYIDDCLAVKAKYPKGQ